MKKMLIVAIWAISLYILHQQGLLTGEVKEWKTILLANPAHTVLIFLAVATLRILALIPSSVFMILGGMLFDPVVAIVLTLVSVLASQTLLFFLSKGLLGAALEEKLVKKYPRLSAMLFKNNTKILAIGILCPLAPSDVACFLASSTGIGYRKFLVTVVISNLPMVVLYSVLGGSVFTSALQSAVIGAIIVGLSLYTFSIWKKEQRLVQN